MFYNFKAFASLVVLVSLGMVGQASASSITYNILDFPAYQNGFAVSGTITTDGTLGDLVTSDITAWSVTISYPMTGHSQTFSSGASGATWSMVGIVQATTSDLSLSLATSSNSLGLISQPFPGSTYGADELLWASTIYKGITQSGNDFAWESFPGIVGTDWIIATTSVPEPSSLLMLGIAAVGLALFRRRAFSPSPARQLQRIAESDQVPGSRE